MIRPQQQEVLSVERLSDRRERLKLGCGCTIERALRAVRPRRAICPTHDRRPDGLIADAANAWEEMMTMLDARARAGDLEGLR